MGGEGGKTDSMIKLYTEKKLILPGIVVTLIVHKQDLKFFFFGLRSIRINTVVFVAINRH